MPFFKTHEVPKGFFDLFLLETTKKVIQGDNREHPMLPIDLYTGEQTDFMVRYYKRSGESSVEDVMEYYPCIVIQDFQPELNKTMLWGKDYVEGIVDVVSGKREIIYLPIPVTYRFQVSIVTRRLKEVQSANDWFLNKFSFNRPDCFEFNGIETDEGLVADIVPYTAQFGEVPRQDGRFEYVFDFTLDTVLHAKSKPYTTNEDGSFAGGNFGDMVEKLTLVLNLKDYQQYKTLITENFTQDFGNVVGL